MEEDEDCDLPKDLGVRTWSKTLSKGERASRAGYKSKTAVMSIQWVALLTVLRLLRFLFCFFVEFIFLIKKRKKKKRRLETVTKLCGCCSYDDYVYCATVFSYFLLRKSERFLAFFLEQSFSTFLSSVLQNPIPRFSCLMCNRRVGFLFNAAGCSSTTRSRYNLHY